jgi:hypothetical protein
VVLQLLNWTTYIFLQKKLSIIAEKLDLKSYSASGTHIFIDEKANLLKLLTVKSKIAQSLEMNIR